MSTDEAPSGEELMAVYGGLLDVVSPEEHAWMEQLMERATIHGNFTLEGTTAALPTLTGDVDRLLALANRYGVSFED